MKYHTPDSMKIPKPHQIGEAFEKFVKDNIFPEERFGLLHQSPSYLDNYERFIHSTEKPDFKFRNKKTNEIFWVECKFRSTINNKNQISILEPYQIERNNILKEPIFYLIGLMGEPDNPKHIYKIPHEEIHPNVYISHAKKFTIYEEQY